LGNLQENDKSFECCGFRQLKRVHFMRFRSNFTKLFQALDEKIAIFKLMKKVNTKGS